MLRDAQNKILCLLVCPCQPLLPSVASTWTEAFDRVTRTDELSFCDICTRSGELVPASLSPRKGVSQPLASPPGIRAQGQEQDRGSFGDTQGHVGRERGQRAEDCASPWHLFPGVNNTLSLGHAASLSPCKAPVHSAMKAASLAARQVCREISTLLPPGS